MGHRSSILIPHGYAVKYDNGPKARGFDRANACIATKVGKTFYAFTDRGHYGRIKAVQDAIPHMARIDRIIEDVVLFEKADGKLLWDNLDPMPNIEDIERQLYEFAEGTKKCGLVHGDLRPWNVFFHKGRITVIDWDLSVFVEDMRPDREPVKGHYARAHPGRPVHALADIDIVDAGRFARLMRGESTYKEIKWDRPGWVPQWCR